MRIDIHDSSRRRRGRVQVDPVQRPSRVPLEDGEGEVFLSWDGTLDDAGHLRKCLCCGCPNLYKFRSLPSVTPIIVIVAFAGAAVGILGYATNILVLGILLLVLIAEVTIFLVARTRLVCYRCRSRYDDTPVANYHATFDREIADQPANQPEPIPTEPTAATPRQEQVREA